MQSETSELRSVRIVDEADIRRRSDRLAELALWCNRRRGRVERGAVDVRCVRDAEEVCVSVRGVRQKQKYLKQWIDSAMCILVLDVVAAPTVAVAITRKAQEHARTDKVDLARRLDLTAAAHREGDDPLADERHGDGWRGHVVCEEARVLQRAVLDRRGLENRVERVCYRVEREAFET